MDGNWETPFNPIEVGRAYTEATAWQYRFFVPHDVSGMAQLFGGKKEFITALDSIFTVESDVHGDLVDITGLIGQYVHAMSRAIISPICTITSDSLGRRRK